MSAKLDQVKVLEQCRINPPLDSVVTTSFPLTFFDIMWLQCFPMQWVFFYQVPFSSDHFTKEVLPQLKNSLSLALQRFLPFCGNCVCPPQPDEPYILYNNGDAVPMLVAQSTGNFADFLKDEPKDAREIHSLVPPIPSSHVLNDTQTEIVPLFALQVTLFPNSGFCIGFTFRHVLADGSSFNHFVKTWATFCKLNCDISSVPISMPVLDKSVMKSPDGIKNIYLDQWRAGGSDTWKEDTSALTGDLVRATFTLSRNEMEYLKKWVTTKLYDGTHTAPKLNMSSFVLASAFIWVCMIKTLDMIKADVSFKRKEELCHFVFTADCRNKYGLGIPDAFFGNCVLGKIVSVARNKFIQEDCVATVAEAISQGVESLKYETLDQCKHGSSKFVEVATSGEILLAVAGSPKLAAYETDFGWGLPAKIEVAHLDKSNAFSLSESKNDKGGFEVGICLSRHQMSIFASFFKAGMNQFL